jgi:beta-glucosidase
MKGRTYRYFDDALFPFGYGLSYTTFEVHDAQCKLQDKGSGTLTVDVTNTGQRSGSETVQVYIRDLSDADGPLKSLRGFQRVQVQPGQTTTVTIPLTSKSFEFWDAKTNTMRTKPGRYEILYGTSSRDADLKRLTVSIAVSSQS